MTDDILVDRFVLLLLFDEEGIASSMLMILPCGIDLLPVQHSSLYSTTSFTLSLLRCLVWFVSTCLD